MPSRTPLEILQALNRLKKRRESMSPDTYVKELHILREELNENLKEPRISDIQEIALKRLLGRAGD